MKEGKKKSPIGVLWGQGKPYYGKFIISIILAFCGLSDSSLFWKAYFVTMMIVGEQQFSYHISVRMIAFGGELGKVVFPNLSITILHIAI